MSPSQTLVGVLLPGFLSARFVMRYASRWSRTAEALAPFVACLHYRVHQIMSEAPNFLPEITGSFAMPAAENPTVEMIEAAYRHHGLHYRYVNFEVAPVDLADAVRGARAMNWAGFNCSLPHKVEVIQYLDGLFSSSSILVPWHCMQPVSFSAPPYSGWLRPSCTWVRACRLSLGMIWR